MQDMHPETFASVPSSLAEALVNQALNALPSKLVHALKSDATCLSRWTGIKLEDLPTDPVALRPILQNLSPGGLGVTRKRIANVKSSITRLLDECGVGTHLVHKSQLSARWHMLMSPIENPHVKQTLSRYGRYCSSCGIEPDQVTDDASCGYYASLKGDLRVANPKQVHRQVARCWNKQAATAEGWPQGRLEVPIYNTFYVLSWSAFEPPLVEAIEQFLAFKANDDPFDLSAPDRVSKPSTIETYRDRLRRYLSGLVLSGVPADSMHCLEDVLLIERVKLGLRYISDVRGKKPLAAAVASVVVLLAIHAKRPDEEIELVVKIASRLRRGRYGGAKNTRGLGAKTRERLLPLKDESNLARLFLLPAALVKRIKRQKNVDAAVARLHRSAVALSILTVCPLRRGALATLRVSHLKWSKPDMGGDLVLQFEEGELKNNEPASFPIPRDVALNIREHLLYFRLHLSPGNSPFLFPGVDPSRPKDGPRFSMQLRDLIFEETGLVVNLHLYRHIVHLIVLRRFPGAYAMVARVLHHRSLSTALTNYSHFGTEIAMAAYQRMVGQITNAEVADPVLEDGVYSLQENPRHGR